MAVIEAGVGVRLVAGDVRSRVLRPLVFGQQRGIVGVGGPLPGRQGRDGVARALRRIAQRMRGPAHLAECLPLLAHVRAQLSHVTLQVAESFRVHHCGVQNTLQLRQVVIEVPHAAVPGLELRLQVVARGRQRRAIALAHSPDLTAGNGRPAKTSLAEVTLFEQRHAAQGRWSGQDGLYAA